MVLDILSTFVDFKNTKEGKKLAIRKGEALSLKFVRVKKYYGEGGYDIRIVISNELAHDMASNGINRFKFMFDEASLNVAIVYQNLKDSYDLSTRKVRPNGDYEFNDKYVSATFLPIIEEKNCSSMLYKGKFLKDKSAYVFTFCGKGKRRK